MLLHKKTLDVSEEDKVWQLVIVNIKDIYLQVAESAENKREFGLGEWPPWNEKALRESLNQSDGYILAHSSSTYEPSASNNDFVGFLCYTLDPDNVLFIDQLQVVGTYQKMGYGKKLLASAIDACKPTCVRLHCFRANSSACHFYTHMGFLPRETWQTFFEFELSLCLPPPSTTPSSSPQARQGGGPLTDSAVAQLKNIGVVFTNHPSDEKQN